MLFMLLRTLQYVGARPSGNPKFLKSDHKNEIFRISMLIIQNVQSFKNGGTILVSYANKTIVPRSTSLVSLLSPQKITIFLSWRSLLSTVPCGSIILAS
jgi:hypothetical protein